MSHTIQSALPLLHSLFAANEPVFVRGTYGIGKTSLPFQLAADDTWKRQHGLPDDSMYEWPVMELSAILMDPVEARGIPSIENGLTKWNAPDSLPQEDRDGKYGFLNIDEINARGIDPGVASVLLQLTLGRRIGDYRLPDGWRIIATGNRPGLDKTGATELPLALQDRFFVLDLDPDFDSWMIWAESNNVRPEVIAFLQWMESRGDSVLHNMEASPRSWTKLSKVMDFIPESTNIGPIAEMKVGQSNAAEFAGFLRVYNHLPRMADILATPESASIPEEASALSAIASALARIMDSRNAESIVHYLGRMARISGGADYAAMAMARAVRRNPAIKSAPAYTAWTLDNPDNVEA